MVKKPVRIHPFIISRTSTSVKGLSLGFVKVFTSFCIVLCDKANLRLGFFSLSLSLFISVILSLLFFLALNKGKNPPIIVPYFLLSISLFSSSSTIFISLSILFSLFISSSSSSDNSSNSCLFFMIFSFHLSKVFSNWCIFSVISCLNLTVLFITSILLLLNLNTFNKETRRIMPSFVII